MFEPDMIQTTATQLRIDIMKMITLAGSGHPGGSLSATDIVATLFFGDLLRYNPQQPQWPERDRFILSKGHAAPLLYAALAHAGYFDVSELATLRKLDSRLQGHPDSGRLPGIEVSTGSLGQGLSIGAGIALGLLDSGTESGESPADAGDASATPARPATPNTPRPPQVFVLMGDGELQEGQNWEAAMFAAHRKLGNLIAIIDYNNLQIDGCLDEVVSLGDLNAKFTSFGFHTIEIDGHSIQQIHQALTQAVAWTQGPTAIIAHTIKGKGVSFMENQCNWHGVAPSDELCDQALAQLTPLVTPTSEQEAN